MGKEVHRACEKNRGVFHRVVGRGKFSTEVHEHSTIRCGKVEALSRRKQWTCNEQRKENQAPRTERFVFRIGGKAGGWKSGAVGGRPRVAAPTPGTRPMGGHQPPCGCSRRGHKPLRLRANPVRPSASLGFAHPLRDLCRCSRRLSAFHCHAAAAARREIASPTPGGPSTAFSLPWAPPCAPALFPCSARLRASLLIRTGY